MTSRAALILGVSGQDGSYLARFLLERGYEVHGTSRDAEMARFSGLKLLGIQDRVKLHSAAPADVRSILQVIAGVRPVEIYNLSGQSSVGLSFEQPVETLDSIAKGTLNILEAIRLAGQPIHFYNAASGECFGDTGPEAADETTPFRPKSPYGVAKAAAYWAVASYREAYGLFACSGILFNHESPLRPARFVTRKIAAAVARIAGGAGETLALGDLSIRRDWGAAPEYVEAMWKMLQQPGPQDFVIATGASHSLEEFAAAAFRAAGLDWRQHVVLDPALHRPSEIRSSRGNAARAANKLDWRARRGLEEIAAGMVRAERRRLEGHELGLADLL